MMQISTLAIVLAAGKGTRMKSDIPKVMHALAGAPMLVHVLAAARAASVDEICVVVGPDMEEVGDIARGIDPKIPVVLQAEQRGTADAVKAAQNAFAGFGGSVIVLYGDTPLLHPRTLNPIRREPADCPGFVGVRFHAEDP